MPEPPSWVQTERDRAVWLAGEIWREHMERELRLRELLRGPRQGEATHPPIHPSSKEEAVPADLTGWTLCPTCRGSGEVWFNPLDPDPQGADSHPCPRCGGEGFIGPG